MDHDGDVQTAHPHENLPVAEHEDEALADCCDGGASSEKRTSVVAVSSDGSLPASERDDVLRTEARPVDRPAESCDNSSPPAKKGGAVPGKKDEAPSEEGPTESLSPPARTMLTDASVFACWLVRTQLADASALASWMAQRELVTRAAVGMVVLLLMYALLFGGSRTTQVPQEDPEQGRPDELPFFIARDLFTHAPRTCTDATDEHSFARTRCTAVSVAELNTGMLLVEGADGPTLRLEDVVRANERYLEHNPQLDVMLPKFWRYADNPRHPASVAAMQDGQFQPCVVTVRGEEGTPPVTYINPRLLCDGQDPDGQEAAPRHAAIFEHVASDLFAPSCTVASLCDSAVVYAAHTVRDSVPKMDRSDAGATMQYAVAVAHALAPFLEFLPPPQTGGSCVDAWREARAADHQQAI